MMNFVLKMMTGRESTTQGQDSAGAGLEADDRESAYTDGSRYAFFIIFPSFYFIFHHFTFILLHCSLIFPSCSFIFPSFPLHFGSFSLKLADVQAGADAEDGLRLSAADVRHAWEDLVSKPTPVNKTGKMGAIFLL